MNRPKLRIAATVLAVACILSLPTSGAGQSDWQPPAGATFQIQLQGTIDTSIEADVFEIDMFDNDPALVAELHEKGAQVVCYISAGSWENWRPDADRFPRRVKGKKLEGWPGERWLDIRAHDVLGEIMGERLDRCVEKGFDGVEFDNVNGYSNPTGFPLKRRHQLAYNRMLADLASDRGLAAGLKNVPELAEELEPVYSFVVNESCYYYRECEPYQRFIENNKAVFVIEYESSLESFCDKAEAAGYTALRKRYSLRAWRRACWERD